MAVLAGLLLALAPGSGLEAVRRPGRRLIGLLVLALLTGIGVVAVWINLAAHSRGLAALEGQAVGPVTILNGALLNVRAEEASVEWLDAKHQPALPTRLLFLGTSGATYKLYDARADVVISVPIAAVRLTVTSQHR
jgi:hypothetical protein